MNKKEKKGLDWLAMFVNGSEYIPNTSKSEDQQIVAQIYGIQANNAVIFSTVSITLAITLFFGIKNEFNIYISFCFILLSLYFGIKFWAATRCLKLLMSFLGKI